MYYINKEIEFDDIHLNPPFAALFAFFPDLGFWVTGFKGAWNKFQNVQAPLTFNRIKGLVFVRRTYYLPYAKN